MNAPVRTLRDFIVSLRLTVVLLACSLVLVFAATLAQVDLGIWAVQQEFFHSFVAIWHVGPLFIPLPGGYLVGGLLFINLLAAHIYRLKFEWRKAGIQLTHAGLIVLLLGELLTGLWQEEYAMRIDEGSSKNYSESYRFYELAVVDTTDANFDDVVAIPDNILSRATPVQHAKLPFRVVTKGYYPNASLARRDPSNSRSSNDPIPAVTQGMGSMVVVTPQPITSKPNEVNVPAAIVELIGTDASLGTWLVSPDLGAPQTVTVGGHTYRLTLRPSRAYKPFSLSLIKFSFDRYIGTNLDKNFSSRVRLTTPDGRDDREVLIYMNNPLRYAGLTFYQADYDHEHEKYTVLQVVSNPSWLLPYIACLMMAAGLVLQFGLSLAKFIGKRRATANSASA